MPEQPDEPVQTTNSLVIPNKIRYKLNTTSPNAKNSDKYVTDFCNDDHNTEKKNLNQDKLMSIIQNKDHSINELKSQAFQQTYNMRQMSDVIQSTDDRFQQLNTEWTDKLSIANVKGQLYDTTISKCEELQKIVTETSKENTDLLQTMQCKDDKISKLTNKIIDQSLVKHFEDILSQKKVNRPRSAVNQFRNLSLSTLNSLSIEKTPVQQRIFSEIQTKLSESNTHKVLILRFLKEIMDITNKEHKTEKFDNISDEYFKGGEYWMDEALALMANYPNLFEKHLLSLKHSIMHNLTNLNAKVTDLNAKLAHESEDKLRRNQIIKKLKFEIKQSKNKRKNGKNEPLLNRNAQQILSNMELIERFCVSQIRYFETVITDITHSIAGNKAYLLQELHTQCTHIDTKWNHRLLSSSDFEHNIINLKSVIKNALQQLDDIKLGLKVHIQSIDQTLNELKHFVIVLNELVSSSMMNASDTNMSEATLFSSTKLSLIMETIENCNHTHSLLITATDKYQKHSLLLQKHLYTINALLSESISANLIKSNAANVTHNEQNVLYEKVETILRKKLNLETMSPPKEQCTHTTVHNTVLECDIRSETAEIANESVKPIEKQQIWQPTLPAIVDRNENIIINKSEMYISSNNSPKNNNENMSVNMREYILHKKKQRKRLGKKLKLKTAELQRCNAQLSGLAKQKRHFCDKQRILKRRKANEIKTINKQISNVIVRPNNSESSIQEMKRLGVKIVKRQLQRRDPRRQAQISQTMIEQMVQRKSRVQSKYAKQIKELDNSKIIHASIRKIENERSVVSENIRNLIDELAKVVHEIKSITQ